MRACIFSYFALVHTYFAVPCRSCWFCWCYLRLLMLLEFSFGSWIYYCFCLYMMLLLLFFFYSSCTIHWAMPTTAAQPEKQQTVQCSAVATEVALEFKAVYFKIVALLQKKNLILQSAPLWSLHISLLQHVILLLLPSLCSHSFWTIFFFFICICTCLSWWCTYTHTHTPAMIHFLERLNFSREISKFRLIPTKSGDFYEI